MTIAANDGAVTVSDASVTAEGTVEVMAKDTVSVEADASVTAGDDVSIASTEKNVAIAGTVLASGDAVVMAETDVNVSGSVTATEGKVDIGAGTTVTVTDSGWVLAGADDVTVVAKDGITVSGSVETGGGDALLTATEGAVSISGNVTALNDATIDAGTTATLSGDALLTTTEGDITVQAKNGITVADNALVTAGESVTLKSTDSGDVTVDTANLVNATDGAVTIAANEGAVTINNTTVTAAGENGKIDIDATADITVTDTAKLNAEQNLEVTTTGGDVTIKGMATVKGKTDLDATGSIVADNANNDFVGVVDATATAGSVELVAANAIKLNDVDAGTSVDVTASDIEVVANDAADTGVNAGEGIALKAVNSIAVNNAVRTEKGNILGSAASGSVTFGEKGSMWANGNDGDDDGSVNLIAAKNIESANKDTAITAKDSVNLFAGENIGSPLNVSAKYLNVDAGGSADLTMKKGVFNENGDLAVDGSKTSIKTGKDLNLTVEGNLATPGGIIQVGNNLDLAVNSATPEVNLTLGGDTIRATDKTQSGIAFKLNGGTQYPKVIGTDSDTAVFIDGRLAGGDSVYYSILGSYEAQAALGMTPDIRGAKADEAPAIFRDKNQDVIDILPNTWDAQIDDAAVVPEEAKASDAASKVARR